MGNTYKKMSSTLNFTSEIFLIRNYFQKKKIKVFFCCCVLKRVTDIKPTLP